MRTIDLIKMFLAEKGIVPEKEVGYFPSGNVVYYECTPLSLSGVYYIFIRRLNRPVATIAVSKQGHLTIHTYGSKENALNIYNPESLEKLEEILKISLDRVVEDLSEQTALWGNR